MTTWKILLAAPALIGLSACAGDYYGGINSAYYSPYNYGDPYSYDGYYDGYYGPIYDGYWGNNGYFYYRNSDRDRDYRRGDRQHFSRQERRGGGHWSRMHGQMTPNAGMRMPNFPHGNGHGRDRDHDHGRRGHR